VTPHGVDAATWTDHTNLRPTILALLGLKDDYAHDGRVLIETLSDSATPAALSRSKDALALSQLYEQLNAPFARFATDTLAASTRGIESTDDSTYDSTEAAIADLTATRNQLVGTIDSALNGAAFENKTIPHGQAKKWIAQGNALLTQADALH
jgi:hypothetical protein